LLEKILGSPPQVHALPVESLEEREKKKERKKERKKN